MKLIDIVILCGMLLSLQAWSLLCGVDLAFGQDLSVHDRVLLTVDETGAADCFFPSSQQALRQTKSSGIFLWKDQQGFEQWEFVAQVALGRS